MSLLSLYKISLIKNKEIGPFLVYPIGNMMMNGTKVIYTDVSEYDINDIAKSILYIWYCYLDFKITKNEFYMEFNIVYSDEFSVFCYICWRCDDYGIIINEKSYIYYKPVFTYILNGKKHIFKHRNIVKSRNLIGPSDIFIAYTMSLYEMTHILQSYYSLVGQLNIDMNDINTELIHINSDIKKKLKEI